MISEFLNAMNHFVPVQGRLMACQFPGDPNVEFPGKWRAFPLTRLTQLHEDENIYLTVSAMGRNERGEFRRRKENFLGGLLLMIDDVGSGPGSKFPRSIVDPLSPTCFIETSPNNYQAVYMFDQLVTDMALFERLIAGFIAAQFLGKDTGMAGVNRVFRPPAGINGKPKYNGWTVVGHEWKPENRYSPQRIADAFGIDLRPPAPRKPRGATENAAENIARFVQVRAALRSYGMLKRENPNMAGWHDVVCPWTGNHTGAVDNGAAIREPAEENDFHGAFRCWHGSCAEKGWRELTEWLAENQSELLDNVNDNAGEFSNYNIE